jgi:hypothetical protein
VSRAGTTLVETVRRDWNESNGRDGELPEFDIATRHHVHWWNEVASSGDESSDCEDCADDGAASRHRRAGPFFGPTAPIGSSAEACYQHDVAFE